MKSDTAHTTAGNVEEPCGETTRNVVEDAINRSKDYGISWDGRCEEFPRVSEPEPEEALV
jgi:hypothetical protein